MRNNIVALALLVSLTTINFSFAGTNYSYEPMQVTPVYNSHYVQQPLTYGTQPLQGSVVMVPAGSVLPATLVTPISSSNAYVGQGVSLVLSNDFYYNNQLVAPVGSSVIGTVIEASKAKHGSMNGRLCIRFTQINTPYGTQIPISAVIKTDDASGVLLGGTKLDVTKDYAKDIATGSASGDLSGLVFGALAGGNVGRGAALGTAVGAGGGLVKSIFDKGDDVNIPANATIELMLTQPITTSVSSYSYEN